MVLVGPVAHLLALQQLLLDVRIAGDSHEGPEPVEPRHDATLDCACRHMAGPADHSWGTETAFIARTLGSVVGGCSAIGPTKGLGTIVGRENDQRIVVQPVVLKVCLLYTSP